MYIVLTIGPDKPVVIGIPFTFYITILYLFDASLIYIDKINNLTSE